MKTHNRTAGYSINTAKQYINAKQVIAYKAWFSQQGLPPFQVKFESEVPLPSYLAIVDFDNLEACEVGYNVYFRAKNVKEVR